MGSFVYDKADYHMGAGVNSWEQASGTALFILKWMIDRDFLDHEYWERASESLNNYRAGKMSLFELYEKECDLCLLNDQFSEEGNAFGQSYFDYSSGRYLSDLESVLRYGSKNYPQFSEDSYQRVKPVIDERYSAWKRGDGGLTLPPESKQRKLLTKALGVLVVVIMFVGGYYLIYFLNWTLYPR
jgi:hypothetical protein